MAPPRKADKINEKIGLELMAEYLKTVVFSTSFNPMAPVDGFMPYLPDLVEVRARTVPWSVIRTWPGVFLDECKYKKFNSAVSPNGILYFVVGDSKFEWWAAPLDKSRRDYLLTLEVEWMPRQNDTAMREYIDVRTLVKHNDMKEKYSKPYLIDSKSGKYYLASNYRRLTEGANIPIDWFEIYLGKRQGEDRNEKQEESKQKE